jgi:hypothetical protein
VTGPAAWHQALAYAVTGRRFDGLGRQQAPDLAALAAFLRPQLGADVDPAVLARPHPLPPDLAVGLGAAQLVAATAELRQRLAGERQARPVTRQRTLTADERRLLDEVPPHHGV